MARQAEFESATSVSGGPNIARMRRTRGSGTGGWDQVNRDQVRGITESWAGLQRNPLGAYKFRFHWLGFLRRFEIEIAVLVGVHEGWCRPRRTNVSQRSDLGRLRANRPAKWQDFSDEVGQYSMPIHSQIRIVTYIVI